jgi:transcription antitermination protein NusB
MASRRNTREWAVQLLFQMDLNPGDPAERFPAFWSERKASAENRAYVEKTVLGVLASRSEIDETIGAYAQNWRLGRMATADRNIMRLAVYEMMHCPDIPPIVSINEAVDLAKAYGTNESGRFVNGVLDRIRKEKVDRPARKAAE